MKTLHCLLCLLVLAAFARANDFYVDGASGSDSAAGTADAPFKTIQAAVNAVPSTGLSRVFVNSGVYQEAVLLNKQGVSLIGVGNVAIERQGYGIAVVAPGVVIENIAIRRCTSGLWLSGAQSGTPTASDRLTVRRCLIGECVRGVVGDSHGTGLRFEETTICCANSVAMYLWLDSVALDRCTIVGNGQGIENFAAQQMIVRNCIVAFNTEYGIRSWSGYGLLSLESNDFFENGSDQSYVRTQPGARDVSEDPQFIDADSMNYALKPSSGLGNRGRREDGLPETIGAHEFGVLSSGTAAATVPFSSWTDGGGRSVTDPAAEVVLSQDGFLRLNGVDRAAALSPVIDLGDPGAVTLNAIYRAFEDTMRPSGEKRVVDSDDTTFAREFRIRASETPFGATDASPAWNVTTSNANHYSLPGQYFQVEVTFTKRGK